MKKWYSFKLWIKIYNRLVCRRFKDDPKKREEFAHWVGEALKGRDNDHFEQFYCREFGYSKNHFFGKKLLDIGCGPSGSLEWADGAKLRVGVDPLAIEYLWLGAWKQKMKYVACGTEKMPFADSAFDVVFTFNAIDHVDDLDASMREISRVLKPGGEFICITDCNHPATITEPTFVPLDFVERYFNDWEIKEKLLSRTQFYRQKISDHHTRNSAVYCYAENNPSIPCIDPVGKFLKSDDNYFLTSFQGKPLYQDDNHLSYFGVEYVWEVLLDDLLSKKWN